jgi:hypothetical protein
MSQKSSLPQVIQFVSEALMPDMTMPAAFEPAFMVCAATSSGDAAAAFCGHAPLNHKKATLTPPVPGNLPRLR